MGMDYKTLLEAIGEEPEFLFKTSRGSTYAHYPDNSTVRNRSGEQHKDTSTGLQPRSGKTVYMKPEDVKRMAGLFQNPELGVEFRPVGYDKETKSGKAALRFTEDYGPKKAGTVIHEAPFTTVPQKGMIPVEINKSTSPVGESGRGIHWGTPIMEVLPGAGARMPARIPTQPAIGGGDRNLLHNMNPMKLMASGGSVKMPNDYSQGGWKLI
jgi:hypothetical protein